MQRFTLFILLSLFSFSVSSVYARIQELEVGNKAPEINLPSINGNPVALSSFKGKLVLIDFWATWCGPCVKEQPELAVIYRKYNKMRFTRGDGFEIYGVSLDAKRENWEKVVKEQKIIWTQVSDLKFWKSPVAQTYKIQALPFNLLIDGNGTVIAMNLHGKELDNTIAKLVIKK